MPLALISVRGIFLERPSMSCDHPLRSVLYVPGDNTRALEKISSLSADAVILDLEDGVGLAKKAIARDNIKAFLEEDDGHGKYITVRVNGLTSDWVKDDLAVFSDNPPQAIAFPKIESPHEIKSAETLLERASFGRDTKLWCMIETPLGVLNAREIAACEGRLECLVMGTSDLVKDLHARHTAGRQALIYSLSKCVTAARAFGLSIIDGVHMDLSDEDSFLQVCQQGADMGFDGKTVFHPKQIDGANKVFSPSDSDLENARKIMAAYEAAAGEGKGGILIDGKLVEALHVEEAKRLLKLAEKIKT